MSTQFIYYCYYLTSRISIFNNELEETAIKTLNSEIKNEELSKIMKKFKTLDALITDLSILISDFFKIMLFLTTTIDLIVIVISIYWIYGGFIFGNNPYFTREFLISIISDDRSCKV